MRNSWIGIPLLAIAAAGAQGPGGFGVNAYTTNIGVFDASTDKAQLKSTPEIGLRYYFPDADLGLDLMLGGALNDGAINDSARHETGDPGARVFTAEVGAFYKLAEKNNAYFGLDALLGFSIQRWADFDKPKPASAYPGFADYTMYIPYAVLAMEPGYFFSPSFSLYTRFGLSLVYFPASQYIDNSDPRYNVATRTYPLKSRNDDNSSLSVTQLGLGVRYFF